LFTLAVIGDFELIALSSGGVQSEAWSIFTESFSWTSAHL
jgi:hypothetical protein